NTYSGAYTVMPMALGATKVVVADDTDAEKIKGAGLWYQWGRKDPLGRASYWGNGNATTPASVAVTALPNTIPNFPTGVTEAVGQGYFFTTYKTGTDNRINLLDELFEAGYITSKTATDVEVKEIAKQINGEDIMVSTDRYMIDKAIKYPTAFIYIASGFNSNWTALTNDFLWGNPQGYNYPKMAQTYKSVFDPCPNGYRMAPKDLWVNFMVDVSKTTEGDIYYINGERDFNKGRSFYYKGMGAVVLNEEGIAIGYQVPNGTESVDWMTDYYPAGGIRGYSTGSVASVFSHNYGMSSSPMSAGSASASLFFSRLMRMAAFIGENRGAAFTIRCVKEN
ncbi:MAG: hypothetical protein NC250_06530, partial [Alistipes senegalensis]|nr:hypothetical protein [Bacteroides cellulosilyticus]MCM1352370.1 hypothetical protein [Alistipes senegalensis]